jgi:allantoinase
MLTVVQGRNVYLNATQSAPCSCTIEINQGTGSVVGIHMDVTKCKEDYPLDTEWIDAGDLVVMPGLVDAHVCIEAL